MEILIVLFVGVLCGALASAITGEKGWNSTNWFLTGLLFGPFGLLAAAGMPDRRTQKYLRYLATQQGWSADFVNNNEQSGDTLTSVEEQRRRILGK